MNEVTDWLTGLGLGQYARTFAEQGIDFDLLPGLTDADLQACGVAALGHRKRLLQAIASMAPQSVPAAAGAADAPAGAAPDATRFAAERRQVTVMFCDLVGFTALSTENDPEDLRQIVGAYHQVVKEAVAPFEGYIAQLLGDGVLVFFGFPRAHEDEAIRALRAAEAIVRDVGNRDFGGGLSLQTRIGIATGLVVVGEIGTGTPAAETGVSGETPNLAARLQAEAPPMGVVISDPTRRQIGEVFRVEPLGELQLKGFARPQRAWRVLGERASRTRFEAMHPREMAHFAGRDAELELLLGRWELAREGRGRAVLLSGDPGVGKSRTSQELRQRVERRGGITLTMQCDPSRAGRPLHPFVRWLEMSADLQREDDPSARGSKVQAALARMQCELAAVHRRWIQAMVSPSAPAPDIAHLPPQEWQDGIRRALVAMLLSLARPRPLMLLLEDAQWIDPATEDLVQELVSRLGRSALFVVVTARPEYQPNWVDSTDVCRVSLKRLEREDCARIMADVAGKPLPDAVVEQILDKTDGVPLFVEEITRAVISSDLLAETTQRWTLARPLQGVAVPATLQDSLMSTLDRLTQAREVAQVGAAIGREFDARLVAAVLDTDIARLRAPLAELEEAKLVTRAHRSGSEYVFRHSLIRDVAYESVLRSVRAGYHGRIARALERIEPSVLQEQPEVLAQHYQQGGDEQRALTLWLEAGGLASRRGYAFAQSLQFYDNALGILGRADSPPDAQTLDVLLLKEEVLGRLGRRAEQMATIEQAVATSTRLAAPARLAGVLLRRANACAYLDDSVQAQEAGHRALEIYRACADSAGEAEALRDLGFLYWRAENYPSALRYAREALAAHRALGDLVAEASDLHNLAEIHHSLGSPRQALEWYRQALELHWSVGNHDGEILTLFGIANALQQSGDLAGSRQKYEEARRLSERHGERTMESRALQALALDARSRGALDEAAELMHRAIEVDRAIGYAHALSHDLTELCAIHLQRGETQSAGAVLREALDWCELTGDTVATVSIAGWLADLDAGRTPELALAERPGWVKSHVPLPEGKVYCEFESPLAGTERFGRRESQGPATPCQADPSRDSR